MGLGALPCLGLGAVALGPVGVDVFQFVLVKCRDVPVVFTTAACDFC